LKHKARSITCASRQRCRDVDCTFGHHCKFGGKGCFADNCWFSDSHYMDLVSMAPSLVVQLSCFSNTRTGTSKARVRGRQRGMALVVPRQSA
jgi:hypothetical protein